MLEKATAFAPEAPTPGRIWAGLLRPEGPGKFKEAAGKARTLGLQGADASRYLKRIEGGETIK